MLNRQNGDPNISQLFQLVGNIAKVYLCSQSQCILHIYLSKNFEIFTLVKWVRFFQKYLVGRGVDKYKWVVKFSKICNRGPTYC